MEVVAISDFPAFIGTSKSSCGRLRIAEDKYPPVVIKTNAGVSSIRLISPADIRGSNSSLGHQNKNLPDGTQNHIEVCK